MFDRFIDYSDHPPEQKLYLTDDNALVLPQDNIVAFLFGEDPAGCAKAFEGKRAKPYIRVGNSHVFIKESVAPFTRDGKPIKFDSFDDSDLWYIKESSGRTKQGARSIKQEVKPRPVLRLPWSLKFTIILVKNELIDETKLYNWFVSGGIQIGFGTYRPRYGRFNVEME